MTSPSTGPNSENGAVKIEHQEGVVPSLIQPDLSAESLPEFMRVEPPFVRPVSFPVGPQQSYPKLSVYDAVVISCLQGFPGSSFSAFFGNEPSGISLRALSLLYDLDLLARESQGNGSEGIHQKRLIVLAPGIRDLRNFGTVETGVNGAGMNGSSPVQVFANLERLNQEAGSRQTLTASGIEATGGSCGGMVLPVRTVSDRVFGAIASKLPKKGSEWLKNAIEILRPVSVDPKVEVLRLEPPVRIDILGGGADRSLFGNASVVISNGKSGKSRRYIKISETR